MTDQPDVQAYAACMEEIKRRQLAISEIRTKVRTTSFAYTNIEFVALQFRKILEIIVFASLASNRALIEEAIDRINNEYRIKNVVRHVRAANPLFYPCPIIRVPSTQRGVTDEWIEKTSGFLTCDALVANYDKLGELLHSRSPYRNDVDLAAFEALFDGLDREIIELLNCHIVGMPCGSIKLYVGMQTVETGAVQCCVFQKIP